jgi:hypothetical protein
MFNQRGIVSTPVFGASARLKGVLLDPEFARACEAIKRTPELEADIRRRVHHRYGREWSLPETLYTFHGTGLLVEKVSSQTGLQSITLNAKTWHGEFTKDNLVYDCINFEVSVDAPAREWVLGQFQYWVELMFIFFQEQVCQHRLEAARLL